MKRVGIIGAGRIFTKHFEAIRSLNKNFKIVGIFDKKKNRNLKASNLCKTPVFKNIDELIKTTKPDIITILVESGKHLEVCKKVILNSNIKNFVIEKPLDVSSKKIINFKNFVSRKNINIFTVKQNRFNKAVVKAKDIIKKKLIGNLFMISASCKWRRDQNYYNLDKWRGKRNLDGGVLMNQAIHHIDLLIHLAGDIKSVVGFGDTKFIKMQSENIAVASLKFKNGCLGTIEATTATSPSDYEGSITIMGSKGIIKIGGFASNKILFFENEHKTKIDLIKFQNNISSVYGEGHKKFYENINLFLNNKIKNNDFDISSSLKSVKVVEKIVMSFKTKKIEKV
jgi:UDP-N-acetyl-2-amino-2-deoxyglucuronate dehydrogenase